MHSLIRDSMVAMMLLCAAAANATTVEFHRSQSFTERGLPLSEAVRVGDLLFLSGQLGFVPGGGLAEGGIEAETRQTMDNIGAQLRRHGLDFDNLVKCLVMLVEIDEWQAFNRIYAGYFSARFPARSAFGGVQLVAGARVEVECVAAFAGNDPPAE